MARSPASGGSTGQVFGLSDRSEPLAQETADRVGYCRLVLDRIASNVDCMRNVLPVQVCIKHLGVRRVVLDEAKCLHVSILLEIHDVDRHKGSVFGGIAISGGNSRERGIATMPVMGYIRTSPSRCPPAPGSILLPRSKARYDGPPHRPVCWPLQNP